MVPSTSLITICYKRTFLAGRHLARYFAHITQGPTPSTPTCTHKLVSLLGTCGSIAAGVLVAPVDERLKWKRRLM